MKKTKSLFMAIKAGNRSTENIIKRYVGISPVTVIALNPNKEEKAKITGREIEDEPVYIGTDRDGKPQVKFHFYVKTDPEWGNNIDLTGLVAITCSKSICCKSDKSKIKVIDDYGETTWVTKEQFQNKENPGTNKRLVMPYRPCHIGEEELINFIKCWLNVKDSTEYNRDTKEWKPIEKLDDCKLVIDWDTLMKGKLDEIQNYVQQYSDYPVKVCFGIRNDDGKTYQCIFSKKFLKNSQKKYSYFEKDMQNSKRDTELFSILPLHEHVVEATQFVNEVKEIPVVNTEQPREQTPIDNINPDDLPF